MAESEDHAPLPKGIQTRLESMVTSPDVEDSPAIEESPPSDPVEEKEEKVDELLEEPEDADDIILPSEYDMTEKAKFIPVRLSRHERKLLRLCESALNVSEYTDKVDIWGYGSKMQRVHGQLRDICAILSGLLVACDYDEGQALINGSRDFKDNEEFFQTVFEIGRRHKIMNPEKMRSEYGKLIYLLMDATSPEIQRLLEFNMIKPLNTVYRYLEQRGGLGVLTDPEIGIATYEILDDKSKSRLEIQRQIRRKEKAVEAIARNHSSSQLSSDQIRLCLYSLTDNHSYLHSNRDPVDAMISLLEQYFSVDSIEDQFSLAISAGREGARLSHNHERQYNFVLQSLTLWREIAHDMFRLWILAEDDLLDQNNRYRLTDTGQGLNRLQSAPRIGRAMHNILYATQRKLGSWVGSSVVHLGDSNVPNALMFIDKYTQVSRILNPIILTIQEIHVLIRDPALRSYIDAAFGGPERLKRTILADFFRHGFDGSGADNFFEAGSCIDGRLTSAWNWCSLLHKKPYYPIFKLAGFVGFDGDFQK